jgi:hypothetical protein
VVILVAEIMNLFLSSALLSSNEPDQRVFAKLAEVLPHVPSVDEHGIPHVPAEQTGRFVDGPLASGPGEKFVTVPGGQEVLEETEKRALRWWSEVMGPGDSYNEEGRKGSLFSIGGGEPDEEVELSVAVLVSEHRRKTDGRAISLMMTLSTFSTCSACIGPSLSRANSPGSGCSCLRT